MANFFVSGGAGFVGSHLVQTLLERGHRVCCLSRSPRPRSADCPNLDWIQADIGESAAYRDGLARVDCVIHLAGLLAARRPEDYDKTNVAGTGELLRAAKAAGAPRRFVYMSSIAAMGPRYDGGLLRESCRCAPESEYGASKLAAERLVLEHAGSLPVVILRPSFVYGEGDTRASTYLKRFLEPMPRPWRSNIKTISVCHVGDVVAACLLAAENEIPAGEVCIIAEPEIYTWDSLRGIVACAFAQLVTGGEVQLHGDGAALLTRIRELDILAAGARRYQYWGCDTRKAQAVLGFQAKRSVRESAGATIRSYIGAGLLSPIFEIRQETHGHTTPY